MQPFLSNVRYALRVLAKTPGFTAIAVLTLALGVGVNTVMFSLVDAVLFRPVPIERPEQVVRVGMTNQTVTEFGGISYPAYKEFKQQADAFSDLAAFTYGNVVNLNVGNGEAERVSASPVTGNYFPMLGLRPAAGRLFGPEDDVTPGGHPLMVLGESFWRRRFAADPNVIGSTVRMNTHAFTIIGVAPRGFHGLTLEDLPEVFVPVAMINEVSPNLAQFKPLERRGFTWLDVVGRLKPGVTPQQATAQLNVVHQRVIAELKLKTADDRYHFVNAMPVSQAMIAMTQGDPQRTPRMSWMLLGVATLVLVIACAVVSGLLLVRGEQRQREIAVRFAVGASRGRVMSQLLTESFLIAATGTALGLIFAVWGTDLVQKLTPAQFPLPLGAATPVLASRVLWFAAGLVLLCTFAFGLIPAWRASQTNLIGAIKQDAALTSRSNRWLSLRNSFVVTQVALSTVLLVGAGLLLRTLQEAGRVELGFDAQNSLVIAVDVGKSGYNSERGRQFYAQLLEQVRQLPGVRDAAISYHVPVSGSGMVSSVAPSNYTLPNGQEPHVAFTSITPGFFRTMGIAIERGRDFSLTDGASENSQVVIVNRAFADRFWPGRDALGERVMNFGEKGAQVIGVVANVKQESVRESDTPMLYVPMAAFFSRSTNLVVRTTQDPRSVLPAVTAAVHNLDRNVPLFRSRTLAEHVGAALEQERMIAVLLSTFGLMALLLAAIGLYGVVSYTTQIRTREFGVRLALGAAGGDLLRLVVGQGAMLATAGLALGLAIAAAAGRVLSTLLFNVQATDALTYGAIAMVLLLVALLASVVPARRAARVDPLAALRYE